MPTWRDRLASRVRDAIQRNLRRVVGRLRPIIDPVLAPDPSEPRAPEPRVREPAEPVVPSTQPVDPEEVRKLVEQLGEITVAAQEIQRRLVELGHSEAAEAITGLPPAPTPLPPQEPLPPPAVIEPPQIQPAEPIPPGAPPEVPPEPSGPPDEPPERQPLLDEERYLLSGTSLYIPFTKDWERVWLEFQEIWTRAAIGAKRDENGIPEEAAPYGADAVARSTTTDPGTRIPPSAMRGPKAWAKWIRKAGYEDGLSIQIIGLLAPPGGRIVSHQERQGMWPNRPPVDAYTVRREDGDEGDGS